MRRVARRLDRDTAEIEPRRQFALRRQIVERGQHQTAEIGEDVAHRGATSRRGPEELKQMRVIEFLSYRGVGIEQPAMLVERESVGHSSEVVGDDAGGFRLAAARQRAPFAGQAFGLRQE